MIIFSTLIILLGIMLIVVYAIKNNENPSKNRTVLRSYNFSEDKNEKNFRNNPEYQECLFSDYQDDSNLIVAIHFNKNNRYIYQLLSKDYSYHLVIYDEQFTLLKDINLKLLHSPEVTSSAILNTFSENGEDFVILSLIDSDNIYYYHFNSDGLNIFKKHFLRARNQIFLIHHKEDEFISISDEDYTHKPIKAFWIKDETTFEALLSDDQLYPEKEWSGYEYIESVTKTNITNQFAFIAHHANYGVQGVKIFKFNQSKKIDLIYDMDDLDFNGAFHNLSFNSKGDRFVVLLYNRDKFQNDSFSICEYSVLENKRPLRVIKTKFAYWKFGALHTFYITDRLVCIVRNSDIIIYNLEFEKLKETLKRDFRSAFYAGNNVLIYQYEDEVISLSY
ncbi:hypothetical protein OD917_08315 [Flavobacterium sp. SH_e]|uniref:hypothetical protein n=1 Tax=Flavobacterium sp. SH_e TaxID=2983767 RepID=UPI0021E3BDA0|nr:hypothetical protein [Flavobacterium sp. SH_e]MCV2484922.1 hypothetical protein [Flavobacterium sp. SH_e]